MADPVEIARLIQDLAGSEERQRVQAGMKLYLAGVNLVMPLLSQWVRDPEFCELTLPDRLADSSIAGAESGSKVSSAHAKYSSSTIVVGLAVHPETFEKIRAANNSPVLAEVPPDQDAREFELHFDDSIELDILTSKEAAAAGAIARFLQKLGKGYSRSRFTYATWIEPPRFFAVVSGWHRFIRPGAPVRTAPGLISFLPQPLMEKRC